MNEELQAIRAQLSRIEHSVGQIKGIAWAIVSVLVYIVWEKNGWLDWL